MNALFVIIAFLIVCFVISLVDTWFDNWPDDDSTR